MVYSLVEKKGIGSILRESIACYRYTLGLGKLRDSYGIELHRSYYGVTPELLRSNIGITQVYVRYSSVLSKSGNGGFRVL